MVKLWGQNKGAYALATVLLAAGCGTLPASGQSAAQPPAASGSQAAAAIWL